jgi:hypothetical protein
LAWNYEAAYRFTFGTIMFFEKLKLKLNEYIMKYPCAEIGMHMFSFGKVFGEIGEMNLIVVLQ